MNEVSMGIHYNKVSKVHVDYVRMTQENESRFMCSFQ